MSAYFEVSSSDDESVSYPTKELDGGFDSPHGFAELFSYSFFSLQDSEDGSSGHRLSGERVFPLFYYSLGTFVGELESSVSLSCVPVRQIRGRVSAGILFDSLHEMHGASSG